MKIREILECMNNGTKIIYRQDLNKIIFFDKDKGWQGDHNFVYLADPIGFSSDYEIYQGRQMSIANRFPTMLRKMWSGKEVKDWLEKQPENNQQWISVADRLPEDFQEVLAITKDGSRYCFTSYKRSEGKWMVGNGTRDNSFLGYWCELPPKPEAK